MQKIVLFLLVFLLWVVLSGKFDAFHLIMGVVSSVIVTLVSGDFFRDPKKKSKGFRLSRIFPVLGFLAWLVYQIVLANINVFALAFSRRVDKVLKPSVIRFKTKLQSDFAKYALGNSITLTPGTVTLAIQGDYFTVHTLMPAFASHLPGEMEARIARIFD